MAEIKLYAVENKQAKELASSTVTLERELQILIEKNMDTFFGVRFLKSEWAITNGRMDSIGIDENGCPVIFEYKRAVNENVINQGLFYLDWLLDHKADFELLVLKTLGQADSERIDWSAPCVICIANDFTKYDSHAVDQIQRNIKLVKYKQYQRDSELLIIFEHLNAPSLKTSSSNEMVYQEEQIDGSKTTYKSNMERLASAPDRIKIIYATVCDFIRSLGDDVVCNELKFYTAFKKTKNIACVQVYNKCILIYLKLEPSSVHLVNGFSRDVTQIGHYGTGNLEITIQNNEDVIMAKSLIERAYNEN